MSLDIVEHKIIVRFSWFIAFSVAVLISFYYFHWFIQFSFSLVWPSYTHFLQFSLRTLSASSVFHLNLNLAGMLGRVLSTDVLQCSLISIH